jgi:hypothetical protein
VRRSPSGVFITDVGSKMTLDGVKFCGEEMLIARYAHRNLLENHANND